MYVLLFAVLLNTPITENLTIIGYSGEHARQTFLTDTTKNELLYLLKGQKLEPVFFEKNANRKPRSFFDWFGPMAVHGEDGRIAFLAKHRTLNGGQPTLFLIRPDGNLHLVVRYAEDRRTRKFSAELEGHLERTSSNPLIDQIPGFKKTVAGFYRTLAWTQDGDALFLFGKKTIFIIDTGTGHISKTEHGKLTVPATSVNEQLVLGYEKQKHLKVLPPAKFGDTPFIYHPKGVYAVHSDGSVKKWFTPKKWKIKQDYFGSPVLVRRPNAHQRIIALANGAYFYYQSMILDAKGELKLALLEQNTRFDVLSSGKEVMISGPLGDLILYDLEKQEVVFQEKLDRPIRGLACSPNGEVIALRLARPMPRNANNEIAKLEKVLHDLAVYRRDRQGLTQVYLKEKVDSFFLAGKLVWFLKDNNLALVKDGQEHDLKVRIPEETRWAAVHRGRVLYSNIPFIDMEAMEKYLRNTAARNHHSQQMFMHHRR